MKTFISFIFGLIICRNIVDSMVILSEPNDVGNGSNTCENEFEFNKNDCIFSSKTNQKWFELHHFCEVKNYSAMIIFPSKFIKDSFMLLSQLIRGDTMRSITPESDEYCAIVGINGFEKTRCYQIHPKFFCEKSRFKQIDENIESSIKFENGCDYLFQCSDGYKCINNKCVCEEDCNKAKYKKIEIEDKTCSEFGLIDIFDRIQSNPPVENILNVFPAWSTKGLSYNSSFAKLSFVLRKSVKINYIRITQDSKASSISVTLLKNNIAQEIKLEIDKEITEFRNFNDSTFNTIEINVNNLDKTNIQNLKIEINARFCLKETISKEIHSKNSNEPKRDSTMNSSNICSPENIIELNRIFPRAQIFTTPKVENPTDIFFQNNTNGLSFDSKIANIEFNLKDYMQLYSIAIEKDESDAIMSIKTYFKYNLVDVYYQLREGRAEFKNFSNQTIDEIKIDINSKENIKNLRASIKFCMKDGIKIAATAKPERKIKPFSIIPSTFCYPLQEFDLLNPPVSIRSKQQVDDVVKIYPDYSDEGANINSTRFDIEIGLPFDFVAKIFSITISQDSNSSNVEIDFYNNGKFVNTRNVFSLSNSVTVFDFANRPINKIAIAIENKNESNIENLKISIKGCIQARVTTPKPLYCNQIDEFHYDDPSVNLFTRKGITVDDLSKLYPSYSTDGANFNSSRADIKIVLLYGYLAKINSITISKNSNSSVNQVFLYKENELINNVTVNSYSNSDTVFLKSDEFINTIIFSIKNSNELKVENLKIKIDGCVIN